MSEIEISKDKTRKLHTDTPLWFWLKIIGATIAGAGGGTVIEKWPVINDSTRIAEAKRIVSDLSPQELSAMQGVQIIELGKKIDELKLDLKSDLKDYDARVTSRLDKHGIRIEEQGKAISRLEVLVPRARANN